MRSVPESKAGTHSLIDDPVVRESVIDHESRITLIESWVREARWLNRAIFGGVITVAAMIFARWLGGHP